MRMNLKVPYAEKDEAKKLGARWDATRKIWYVENKADIAPFSRWSPTPHADSANDQLTHGTAPVVKQQAIGKIVVGSRYCEPVRICECLPWEVCPRCQTASFNA